MKKPFCLAVTLAMMIICANSVCAQGNFAHKTRYVYLWDVTGSTVSRGKTELFSGISGFLKQDIERKPDGTEVVIIPFNDHSLSDEIMSFKTGDSNVCLDTIIAHGREWAKSHLEEYRGWKNQKDKQKTISSTQLGFTNVAGTVADAAKYINSDYNTIFILLTDGGQEYLNRTEKRDGSTEDAKAYLRQEIKSLDDALANANNSINMLFYVVVKGSDDPRDGDANRTLKELKKTEFITPTQATISLQFVELKPIQPDTISVRDKDYKISFENMGEVRRVLNGKDVAINVIGAGDIKNIRKTCKLNLKDGNIVIEGLNLPKDASTITGTITLEVKDKLITDGNNYIGIWTNISKIDFTATRKFKPTITVTVE